MNITDIRRANLSKWVAENGIPQKEKSLFSQLRGDGSFGEKVARRLEKDYKMDPGYLDTPAAGEEAAADPVVESSSIRGAMRVVISDDSDEFYHIPKVRLKLQAGITGFKTEPDRRDGGTRGIPRSWADRNGYDPKKLLAIDIKGESMEPRLFDGDCVIVNTADIAKKDGEVFAFNYDGEAVIKRLVRERGEWWLFSDNADQVKYRPKSCRENECIIIGRVVRKESNYI